ncbi:MAG TPA: hopanoid biosynthesis-associated protein HpnK [Rhizomicrobium sp.]|nr:hopanoid biosynthesis-associated protein HpnK [Rhizomicrobium sp.]
MKQLVVTADDFGAAREVNEAVEIAHTSGILTAASLMVAAPAACEAVAIARRLPSLRVGLHIVLVDGRPLLPPDQVPDLVDQTGNFRNDMAVNGARMFFLPSVRHQLEHEISAQFEAFRATGLTLDHVNAHKHFHLHPTIASMILRIGPAFGMWGLRVPREPAHILAKVEPGGRPDRVSAITGPWASLLASRAKRKHIAAPDHVYGLRWSGAMTAPRVEGVVRHLRHGLNEIYLHPATGPYPGSAPGYAYAEELAALTAPGVREATQNPHIKLGGYRDFR